MFCRHCLSEKQSMHTKFMCMDCYRAKKNEAKRAHPEWRKVERANHPEYKERARFAYASNIEAERQRSREYYARRGKYLKALREQIPRGEKVSPSEINMVKEAFGFCCAYCGEAKKLTIDHVIPYKEGGRLTKGNMLPACQTCNSSKGTKNMVEWYKSSTVYSSDRLEKIQAFLSLG